MVIFEKDKKNRVSYANRQLIAREVEMEKMRRLEAQISKSSAEVLKNPRQDKPPSKAASSDQLPNHLRKLEFGVAKRTSKSNKVSFFKNGSLELDLVLAWEI